MYLTFGQNYALHGLANGGALAWFSGVGVAGATLVGSWSGVIEAHAGRQLHAHAGQHLEAHSGTTIEVRI